MPDKKPTKELLKTWDRIERTHQGSWTVKAISGKVIIHCSCCPNGRYMKTGEAGYYLAPDTHVLIIAVEPSVIEWRSAYMYGFTGEVSRQIWSSEGGAL